MVFRYRIVKKAIGTSPYTTRPELGTPLTEAEVLKEIEAATSVTVGDVKNTFTTLRRILIAAALSGRPTEVLFDVFRISHSSGGSIDDPTATLSIDDIDPRVTIYLSTSIQKEVRNNLTLERIGMAGDRTPQLDTVRNLSTNTRDTYTAGNVLRINGDYLKLDPADPEQGVFFRPQDGTPIRATQYINNTKRDLTVFLPATLSGPLQLRVRAKFGQSLREAIYPTPLLPDAIAASNAAAIAE